METRRTWPLALLLMGAVGLAGCAEANDEGEEMGAGLEGDAQEEVTPLNEADYGYAEWDVDRNRGLNEDEFGTWAGEQEWGETDQEGFTETTYGLWDIDDDDAIGEQEWAEATDRWYGADVDYGTWADWDGDGDSELDLNEVREGFERYGLYDRVDRDSDAVIDDEEIADWWFDVWDFNDDMEIDTTEWDWGSQSGYTGTGA